MAIRVPPGGSSLGSFLSTTSALALGGPRSQIVNGWAPDAPSGLDIDFTAGTLDSRITFARASTATYYDASGLIASAASGAPRFDYDPVTLAARGLLLEEQRTNYVPQSAFASGWTFDGSTSGGTTTAPDGTSTALRLVESTGLGEHRIYQSVASGPNTHSIYAKQGTRRWVSLRGYPGTAANFDLLNGIVGTSANCTPSIQAIGGGWYRCNANNLGLGAPTFVVINMGDADTGTSQNYSYAGDNVSDIYIWGAQAEIGAFTTSYIPTASVAVTRAADTASMTGTNFSSWFNNTEGTFTLDCILTAQAGSWHYLNVFQTAAATANRLVLFSPTFATALTYYVDAGGANQVSAPLGTNTADGATISKFAIAYKANDFGGCVNGGTVVTDAAGSVPTVDKLVFAIDELGTSAPAIFRITRLRFFNTRKTDAELQTLTAASAVGAGALVAQAAAAASTTGVSGSTNANLDSVGFDNVVFLSGFEGADASTTVVDEATAKTVTVVGNAQIDTAQFKIGTSSLLLDGVGDYVTMPDSADWDFGTGPFTIEGWFRFAATPTNAVLLAQWPNGWAFWFANNVLGFRSGGFADTTNYTWFPPLNTWHHIAIDRDASSVARVYVGGAMVSKTTSYTTNLTGSSSVLCIGSLAPGGFGTQYDLNGWVDEVRVTKNVARYASDAGFTVPTAAFPRGSNALAPQSATMIGAGASSSTITDTTLNASAAVLSSTTGVSGSLITDTTLNASAAALSSTAGLVRAIANPSALTAQAATVIGLGTGAGAATVGGGALSSRPATLASTGLVRAIGSGALVDGVATLSALAVSGSTGIGDLDATAADINSLGYVEQGGVSIMIGGEWQRTTPYVRVGGTWKPATAWANVNGAWKRVA